MNNKVYELLEISKNKVGLLGFVDIDQNIILNADYDVIIKLLIADPSSRNLIYKLLPQIIKNNENEIILNFRFLCDLIEIGEIELVKKSWILVDENDADDMYYELGQHIHESDQIVIENYLKSTPLNYDWDMFLGNYLDKEYNDKMPIIYVLDSINRILAAAVNVKNDFIINKIKKYWEDEELSPLSKELLKMKKLLTLYK